MCCLQLRLQTHCTVTCDRRFQNNQAAKKGQQQQQLQGFGGSGGGGGLPVGSAFELVVFDDM
jgi:hypothetical protein